MTEPDDRAGRDAAVEQARSKLVQIYRYLQALNELRNPVTRKIEDQPWTAWLGELPEHECIRRGKLGDLADEDFVLKVGRPDLSSAPPPPQSIAEWIQPGWDRIDGTAATLPVREEQGDAGGTPSVVRFEDEPERTRVFAEWARARDGWVERETPARQALALFERLYALRARIEREAERVELVVGDGLLEWDRADGNRIRHPMLLQRVELQFEPAIPEFTIVETEHAVELYTALFSSMPDVQPQFVSECQTELDESGVDPLGGDDTDQFLRRLVTRVSPHGAFVATGHTGGVASTPRMSRAPVLFLRSRTLGLGEAIAAILEDLQTRDDLPDAVTRIVGIEPEAPPDDDVLLHADSWNGEHEDILFSKEANAEQLEIAQRLERYGSVLVQGPPGTGKTHTIANLLGHLLAEGKSVLVTSHTAKALTVLRDKVVEPLRPLCLSVGVPIRDAATGVESETYSRKLMENAIDEITERLSSASAPALMKEAEILAKQRLGLLERLRDARMRLQSARQDEYRPVVIAGTDYAPAQAAREVAAGQFQNAWIPTPVTPGAPLPLTPGEIADLYRSNAAVTVTDETELGGSLPAVANLMSPPDLQRLAEERLQLLACDLDIGKDLWSDVVASGDELREILSAASQAVEPLDDGAPWRIAAIAAGREGGQIRAAWESLLQQVKDVVDLAAEAQEALHRFGPELPDNLPLADAIEISRDIRAHLEGGGHLGRVSLTLHRNWKWFIDDARVSARPPDSAEHFAALEVLARLRSARELLVERWQRQMAPLGAYDAAQLGERPEAACRQYSAQVSNCLGWYEGTWVPLHDRLVDSGFLPSSFLDAMPPRLEENGDLLRLRDALKVRLPVVLGAQLSRTRLRIVEACFEDLARLLAPYAANGDSGTVVRRLRESVVTLDVQAYRVAYERLVEVEGRRSLLARRRELLEKLDRVAPGWAAAIRTRLYPHGDGSSPGDAQSAWVWRQLCDELERRGATSIAVLQEEIAGLTVDMRRATAALIEKRAWAHQVERTTLSQRQALLGWKATVRKIGKGTGIRAPLLRAKARRLMPECQTAVPVWVMPLSLVVQNFHPARNRFDVVIIDEASQADVMSLVALYLGSQVVVVGDHEQVSPDAVGQAIANVQQLIDTHLLEIPNRHLYDPQLSIYDLAMMSFEGIVCLREHFRCVPDIIEFSNLLSYEGKIKPLRDASSVSRQPFTVAYRVEGVNEGTRVNRTEARTVASLVVACTEQPEYDRATFGVISLVGDDQAYQIESILRRRLSVSEYVARMIRCGTSAQFQGDERDVMFLSVVDAPTADGPLTLRGDGANLMFKKRFNVASSRACDQMWVVHSLDEENDLKQGDLRKRLIEHAKDPRALSRSIDAKSRVTESEFERLVLQTLVARGFRVTPQWSVGAYRIDMVVEGNGRRLAIECDGDRWHPEEQIADDMARQAILERLGWQFVRIRGSQFFRAPDDAMVPVFERLAQLGIEPEADKTAEEEAQQEQELRDRVIRRAAELCEAWADDEDEVDTRSRASAFGRSSVSSVPNARAAAAPAQPPPTHEGAREPNAKPVSATPVMSRQVV
ncbi:MAG: AAA family ATPase [Candidatus Binataceae bacterium]|nr:AAA family ATPase [Candidatus Binataceae bacterium]